MDNAFDLLMATDDRIKRTSASSGSKVDTHLINGRSFGVFGIPFMWSAGLAQHLNSLRTYFLQIDPQAFEDPSGDAFTLANQA